MNELIHIKDLESIEGSSKIIASFSPKAGELNELYPEYDEIVKGFATAVGVSETELDTADEDKQAQAATTWASKAKALRAKMVKVRTSTEVIRKEIKAEYLPVTKAIDSMGKLIKDTSQEAEATLAFIADTEKRLEEARLARLEAERVAALTPYADGAPLPSGLSTMDDATWDAILTGWKSKHDQKLREEKEAAERQEREKLGTDRKLKAAPLAEYIPGFAAMDFSAVSEEEFEGILEKAEADKKKAQDDRDAEMAELRKKAGENEMGGSGIPERPVTPVITSASVGNTPYIAEIKNYLFGKMMSAPSPAEEDLVRKAMEALG